MPNPLRIRHDEYRLEFTVINKYIIAGGSIIFTHPGTFSSPDSDCNLLHGLHDNQIRLQHDGASSWVARGFDQYDPGETLIRISCKITNPNNPTTAGSAAVYSGNWSIYVLGVDGDATTLYMQETAIVGFSVDHAYREFVSAEFEQQYRTQKEACIPTDHQGPITINLQVKRQDYPFLSLVRLKVPAAVTQSAGSTIECTWDNGSNVTPAEYEYCGWENPAAPEWLQIGITDQLELRTTEKMVITFYTRDPATPTNLMDNGFIWPSTPQNLHWYLEVEDNGTLMEAAKITTMVCPQTFSTLVVEPFHKDTAKWNIFDVTFDPVNQVPIGGALAVEFMTDNELEEIFEMDLGYGLDPLVLDQAIDCMVQTNFGGATPGDVTCSFTKVTTQEPDNPVIVVAQGAPGTIDPGTSNKIRMVKIKNPPDKEAYILGEPLMIHFTVYTYNTLENDKYHLNRQTLFRVFNYGELLDPIFTVSTPPAPTISQIETYVTISPTPMSATLTLGTTTFDHTTDYIIYEFDPAFVLPTTGAAAQIVCDINQCQIYSLVNWILYWYSAG